ncbi:hypothetical protein PRUPE_1G543800 [Prunus persica]|uniref:Uncharacterized protein n=1 Tax=Prunus persica TaxID=3760 RepID=A0A251RHM5_PRUPE|nr:hypothetical protein PRUPE_1G543800 [Prunus persica]
MVLASEDMSEGQDEEEDDAERVENSKFNIELVIHQTELFRIEGLDDELTLGRKSIKKKLKRCHGCSDLRRETEKIRPSPF